MSQGTDDPTIRRVIGKRRERSPCEGCGPSPELVQWSEEIAKGIRLRVPKGVFRYRSHEEANADWERWMAGTMAERAKVLYG